MDTQGRAAIALVFMRGGGLASPAKLNPEEEESLARLGANSADVGRGLQALRGSFLIPVEAGGSASWRFKHPTIRDAFGELIADDPELLDIYLRGTPIERLLSEVACGGTRITGVRLKLPASRYEAMIVRLEGFMRVKRENLRDVRVFIAFRCGREFIAQFIERNPDFVRDLQVSSYFYAVSDIDVINRLFSVGLLPEADRQGYVAAVKELAVSIPDAGFLNRETVGFLTNTEFNDILATVRNDLLPELDRCVGDWRDNYTSGEDPDDYFDHLVMALRDYRKAFEADEAAVRQIDSALVAITDICDSIGSATERPQESGFSAQTEPSPRSESTRSIFEDVDQ
jgi:hypothetical protein